MTKFKPCIDLLRGKVAQIVGATLSDTATPQTNYIATDPAEHFVAKYKNDNLCGGHVIMLGPGSEEAAINALQAWPGGLQVGGGINDKTAKLWIDRGAEKVIVSSWFFVDGLFSKERAQLLCDIVGRERIVIDLSCKRTDTLDGSAPTTWHVAINRWQTQTDLSVTSETLHSLAQYCSEFLVHATAVEGRCSGIDRELVVILSSSPVPVTYAGGAQSISDLQLVDELSHGKVDLTIGSALDIFGGTLVSYNDCVAWNRLH